MDGQNECRVVGVIGYVCGAWPGQESQCVAARHIRAVVKNSPRRAEEIRNECAQLCQNPAAMTKAIKEGEEN